VAKPNNNRGELLRRVRKFLGLTQGGMAEKMCVSEATLSQYETGAVPLPTYRLDTLEVLVTDAKDSPTLLLNDIRRERGNDDIDA
jgi:transcriptional regulator with XRE-family HTH domain